MTDIFTEFHKSASSNITGIELVFFLCLATLVWKAKRKFPLLPVLYGIFLIVYITLLRRAPGYNENIRIRLQVWNNAGVFIGNLLNVALYMPFGYTLKAYVRKISAIRFVGIGLVLSAACEVVQYFTGRGTADINDVVFNTLGLIFGGLIGRIMPNACKKDR